MLKLRAANLTLFEGEGGGEGSETGANDLSTVVYGKGEAQAEAEASEVEAGDADQGENETSQPTPEERKKAYKDLIKGEYKDLYTEDTQNIIDRRFKETKQLEQRLSEQQNILDILNQRYKVADGDLKALTSAIENDDMYWENVADELGMSTDQAKEWTKMERQNKALLEAQNHAEEEAAVQQQLADWFQQSEALKETFPEFDLENECQNEGFLSMLKAGVPIETAYKAQHMDDIMQGVMLSTKATTEKRVADNIRARGNRPVENGTSSQSGFVTKSDVSKLTKADRAEIAKRALRGDNTIVF